MIIACKSVCGVIILLAELHPHSGHSAKQSLEGLSRMETGLWLCWERDRKAWFDLGWGQCL